jgi:hypothetical protein
MSVGCADQRTGSGDDDDDSSSTDDDDTSSDDDDDTSSDDDDDTASAGADVGSTDGLDDLGCGPTNPADVWTIELAGTEAITARVDTIAADTAFDPAIVIVDGTDLSNDQLATNDEAFTCTWLPTEFQCPEVSLMMGPGTFAVVVLSYGSCTGTIAEYQLDVRSGPSTVVPVTMVADDINPPQ